MLLERPHVFNHPFKDFLAFLTFLWYPGTGASLRVVYTFASCWRRYLVISLKKSRLLLQFQIWLWLLTHLFAFKQVGFLLFGRTITLLHCTLSFIKLQLWSIKIGGSTLVTPSNWLLVLKINLFLEVSVGLTMCDSFLSFELGVLGALLVKRAPTYRVVGKRKFILRFLINIHAALKNVHCLILAML